MGIFDPIFGSEDRRWGGSATFGVEERRWGGFFDLRGRWTKVEDGVIYDVPAPKIEDGGVLRSSGSEYRKTTHLRFSATKIDEPPIFNLRIFGPEEWSTEEWVKDRTERRERGVRLLRR